MKLLDLVRDWWQQTGPEHWDPDQDADVAYLRKQKSAAEDAMEELRGTIDRYDVAEALRQARRAHERGFRQ